MRRASASLFILSLLFQLPSRSAAQQPMRTTVDEPQTRAATEALLRSLADSLPSNLRVDVRVWPASSMFSTMLPSLEVASSDQERADRRRVIEASGLRAVDALSLPPCGGVLRGTMPDPMRTGCPPEREIVVGFSAVTLSGAEGAVAFVAIQFRSSFGSTWETYRYQLIRDRSRGWILKSRTIVTSVD